MTAIGAGLSLLVWGNWDLIVQSARSLSTAAGGLVASLGVAILGLVLLWASRGRAEQVPFRK